MISVVLGTVVLAAKVIALAVVTAAEFATDNVTVRPETEATVAEEPIPVPVTV